MSSLPGASLESPKPFAFRHPYLQLVLSILMSAAAQLFLKLGAGGAEEGMMGFGALRSGWVWLGIVAMIGSLFSWLHSLRYVPLSTAFTLAGAVHFLVPIGSWLFLGEVISPKRWLGIGLVLAGVLVSAKPATAAEEKL